MIIELIDFFNYFYVSKYQICRGWGEQAIKHLSAQRYICFLQSGFLTSAKNTTLPSSIASLFER